LYRLLLYLETSVQRASFIILVLASLAGCNKNGESSSEQSSPPPKTDAELIQGTWVVVSSESEGKAAPAEGIKDETWNFTAKQLTIKNPKVRQGKDEAQNYSIDSAKSPKEIDFEMPETIIGNGSNSSSAGLKKETLTQKGIYALDGDTLKICFSNGFEPTTRPTDFATREGGFSASFVLKREKK
jgi:uncharacterized protein (TIGR03067 family)